MLSQLYINNVAVISKATIELAPGLNVFTGETGAGKTILIHAIHSILGQRVSKDLVRSGEERAVVAATFEQLSPQHLERIRELGFDLEEDEPLLIRREIRSDGKSVCKINGQPATASLLREATKGLIQIHGQHDSQQLLEREQHLEFVDRFGNLQEDLQAYQQVYHSLLKVRREMSELQMDESEKVRTMDLLRYQIDEIQQAQLQIGEEEELQEQRKVMKNAVHITELLSQSRELLEGGEELPGLLSQAQELSGLLSQAQEYLSALAPWSGRVEEFSYLLQDCQEELREQLEMLEYDPQRLEEIEDRLDEIHRLQRKYAPTIEGILAFQEQAQHQLDQIEFSQENLLRLQEQEASLVGQAKDLAGALSQKRSQASQRLMKLVEEELAFLEMPHVRLFLSQKVGELGPKGQDTMEFLISTNPGEAPKPLEKIASGGELSRIMLSLENVLAQRDEVSTSIFDEVDTGVSGRAAGKIGRKLKEVSRNRQVIVVTHLAQVAAYGDHHLFIFKEVQDGRTFTQVQPLDFEGRKRELARIMTGDASEISLKNAQELLENAKTPL